MAPKTAFRVSQQHMQDVSKWICGWDATGARRESEKAPDAIRLSQAAKSAVLEHVQDQVEPHTIDWESLKTIDHERGTRERKVRESFLIFRWNQRSTGTQALREVVYGMLVWQNYCMILTFPIETNGGRGSPSGLYQLNVELFHLVCWRVKEWV